MASTVRYSTSTAARTFVVRCVVMIAAMFGALWTNPAHAQAPECDTCSCDPVDCDMPCDTDSDGDVDEDDFNNAMDAWVKCYGSCTGNTKPPDDDTIGKIEDWFNECAGPPGGGGGGGCSGCTTRDRFEWRQILLRRWNRHRLVTPEIRIRFCEIVGLSDCEANTGGRVVCCPDNDKTKKRRIGAGSRRGRGGCGHGTGGSSGSGGSKDDTPDAGDDDEEKCDTESEGSSEAGSPGGTAGNTGTPASNGPGTMGAYPIEGSDGTKVESRVDLRVPLTGSDFKVMRSYTSYADGDFDGDADLFGYVGSGWRLSIFQMLAFETNGGVTTVNRHFAASNSRFEFTGTGSGPFAPVGGGSTQSIEATTTTIDGVTYDVWRLREPGRWYADYFRVGGSNAANSPSVLDGRILQQVDEFGNPTVYRYSTYLSASPPFALLRSVYLNGTRLGGAEARLHLVWNLETIPSSTDIQYGTLDAIWVGRPNPSNPPTSMDPDGLDHWIDTEFVDYEYFGEFDNQDPSCGLPSDLVQVTWGTRVDSPATFEWMGDKPFDLRIEQYRYHGNAWTPTSSDERVLIEGYAHQLKSVILPQQIQYAAQQYNEQSNLWTSDSALVMAAAQLQSLADDDIAFLDSNGSTNRLVMDLASKLIGYDTGTTSPTRGQVEVEYIQSGCGCGSGGAQGLKVVPAYDNTNPAAPFMTVSEYVLAGGTYTTLHRTVRYDYAITADDIPMTTAFTITAPSPDGRSWVTSFVYDTDNRLIKKVLPSGLTYGYAYDSNHRQSELRISPTSSGAVSSYTLLEKWTYRTTGRTDLLEKHERFRVAGSTAANDVETTLYDYGFRSGSNHIAWFKETVEAELEGENGPGGTYSTYELFDAQGLRRWSRAADGALTFYDYSPLTGSLIKVVRNADPAAPDGESGDALDGATDYAGLVTTGWTQPDASGELTTRIKVDLLGREIERETPGGVKHYTIRDVREETVDRPKVLYRVTVSLPFQLADDTFDGPATLTWRDSGGATVRQSDYAVVDFAYSPPTFDYTLSGELSRGTVRHGMSGLVSRRREYHDIANNGFYDTTYAYDLLGRVSRVTNANGSITAYENYNVWGQAREVKTGTSELNLVTVRQSWFDSGGTTTEGVGDGNLTLARTYVSGSATRDAKYTYDFRNRLIRTQPPTAPYELRAYDNLDRVTSRGVYSVLPTHAIPLPTTNRGMYSEAAYSQRGHRFVQRVATDPTSGSPVFLESHYWYDSVGRTVAEWMPNSAASKRAFDAHGRTTIAYSTDRGGDAAPGTSGNYADVIDVDDDIALEQSEFTYNAHDRLELVTTRQRLHDAAAPGSGLSGALTNSTAVTTSVGYAYDDAQRQIRTVNFGTNDATSGYPSGRFSNGSAPTWPPSSVPDWSNSGTYANALITGTVYDVRGLVERTIDSHPDGRSSGRFRKILYDDLNRRVAIIENYIDATVAWNGTLGRREVTGGLASAADEDRVTSFVYDGLNNVTRQVAHLPNGSGGENVQVTEYIYAADSGSQGSLVDSNNLLSEVRYPDEGSGAPGSSDIYKVKYRYNRLGELLEVTDQNQTEHAYERDVMGRVTRDDVTAFGTGIDQSVKGIEVEYDDFGRLEFVTSRSAINGGGTVLNQVEFAYNELWQIETVIQDPDSALSVLGGNSIPQRSITYTYDTQAIGAGGGPGNYSRLEHMRYPGGDNLTSEYDVQPWDSRISRLSRFAIPNGGDVDYHFVGQSMFAGVDYVAPWIQLDRTLSVDGKRRLAGQTSQTAGVYPGWDRFGRVISQTWVDGELDEAGTGVADRPQIVYETHTYDRSSNRLSKHDARDEAINGLPWASQDNQYSYDGLDRLVEAKRGRWNATLTTPALVPSTGGLGSRDSSQQWNLDMLGNWTRFARDIDGDGDCTSSPVIPPATTGDWIDDRTHNFANEIETSFTRNDGATPTPAPVPFAYDDAGNLSSARQETVTGAIALADRGYVHDAWNRLVEVRHDIGGADFTIARYSYNGLHWRVLKHGDMRTVQTVPSVGSDSTNRREAMYYDASWRLVHREIEDGFDPTASPAPWAPDVAEQLFWGARYIDDIVARRRTTAIADTEPLDVTWADAQWYLTDAQFSVVALMDSAGVQVLERVRYDPYGNAEHIDVADYNGNGDVTVQDLFDWLAGFNAAPPKPLVADFNRSGTYSVDDTSAFIGAFSTVSSRPATPHGSGWISNPASSDSVVGYCGYIHNHETADYTVRFRTYIPSLGRWGQRDPIGSRYTPLTSTNAIDALPKYVEGADMGSHLGWIDGRDGPNLYEYVRGNTVALTDSFGLASSAPSPQSGDTADTTNPCKKGDYKDEARCMAAAVFHEARGQTASCQRAIAWVMYNRTQAKGFWGFKGNVCDEIWRKNQFEGVQSGKSNYRKACEYIDDRKCDGMNAGDQKEADEVLDNLHNQWHVYTDGNRIAPHDNNQDPTGGADHYVTPGPEGSEKLTRRLLDAGCVQITAPGCATSTFKFFKCKGNAK